ncbi:alpha/beta fold hydrolase, partial [Candidatus Microgenomates bacterium]|nr:alpha/beta fold hydrolase [Candidatus Microgenomates bacterium]
VDMEASKGTDKNLIFRFQNGSNWYGIHHGLGRIYFEKIVGGVDYTYQIPSVGHALYNNVVYHFKIILQGRTIQIYINDDLIFDFIDQDPVLETGKAGLRAGTGAVFPTEVWFDNIVVTSLDEEKEPIVLVPGHGASWCLSAILTNSECEPWKMTPFVKVYDNLIATLENAGYEQNQNLFIFYYDWRKNIADLADDFAVFIEDNINNTNKATLIGHSMGGMVSRAYLQDAADPPIEKLITIGSPHEGIPIAYSAWEGGEIWSDNTWQWLALQLFLQTQKKGFQTNMDVIRNLSPSTKDLLPVFNYLKKDSQEINVNNMHQQNEWLKNLNTDLTSSVSALLTTMVGENHSTLNAIQIEDRSSFDELLDKWEDGKPTGKEFSTEGDGTILLKSAAISGVSIESLNLNHSSLVSEADGLAKIIDLLDLSITDFVTDTQVSPRSPSLVFLLHSPAEMTLKNPPSGTITSEEDKLIVVPNAQTGEYELEITGTESGIYHLEIGQLTENEDIWQTLCIEISLGETQILQIDFNSETPKTIPVIDNNGSLSLTIARTKIDELKDYINDLSIRSSIKNRLLYYLDRILRQIQTENGRNTQRALAYLYQLRTYLNRCQKYNLISENENTYIKNSLKEIADYLENAYVKLMTQSGASISSSRVEGFLTKEEALLTQLKSGAKNKGAAVVFQIAEEKLNQAREKFNAEDYFSAEILNYSARFLDLEASRM